MSEIEWGPEIKVDGKRPEWLRDEKHQWIGVGVPAWDAWNSGANFVRDRPGVPWDTVRFIRIPADHPYYAKQSTLSGADGSSYYDLQINGVTVSCNDVIDALGMNFNMGEAFKALWRCGRKPGTSKKYDLDKVVRFAQREANRDA